MLRINVLGGLYVTGDGRPLSGAAAQPRRLALLALLAVAGDRGVTRDNLLAYVWPDADEERGRRALTQGLYALRRDLGTDEAFLGMKDLRLNPDRVRTDLAEFREARGTGDLDRAAALYRGPFLEGFNLAGSDTFERWVEEQRGALAHEYAELLDLLATRASARGDHRAAAAAYRRLAGLDPLNARTALRLMQVLADAGDRTGALLHARVYETLVRQEFDLPPDREVVALAERLRATGAAAMEPSADAIPTTPVQPGSPVPVSSVPSTPPDPTPKPVPSSVTETGSGEIPDVPEGEIIPSRPGAHTSGWATMNAAAHAYAPMTRADPRRARWAVRSFAVILVVLATVMATRLWPWGAGTPPVQLGRVVAVGRIAHYAGQGTGPLGLPLGDMLATNLARIEGLKVVSNARMVEVLRQLGAAGDSGSSVAAARQAGATELVDGALYDVAPGQYRLDLRRVDLASGSVLQAYTVRGTDLFGLADSGTGRLAGDFGARLPVGSVADVSTRSVPAYQAYEQGLRLYYAGDLAGAERLFTQSLLADSSFAMAAFYRAQSLSDTVPRERHFQALRRAMQLAEGASDRERLLIAAAWAWSNSSPALRAIAETLTVRYPAELEGFLMAGQAAILAGEYDAAHAPLNRVIARDSLGLRGATVRCLACEAFAALLASYTEEDSLDAALRVTLDWIRLQPQASQPWRIRAYLLAQEGKIDSAFRVLQVGDSLFPGGTNLWEDQATLHLYAGRLTESEEVARVQLKIGPQATRTQALWALAAAYRHAGRMREALDLARQYRKAKGEQAARDAAPLTAFLEGQVLFERGEFRASAALFDSMSRSIPKEADVSWVARNRAWTWSHMASALAAVGDTARLAAMADSIERFGRVSAFARDRKLHFYVRGLLAQARNRHEDAIVAFRSALVSPVMGFTRINYALAGELLAVNRPTEAIPLLQAVLRGGFEGSGLYLNHTDAAERLAHAFEQAGRRDSAAVYYQRVAQLWDQADPEFTPRRFRARGNALRMRDPS